MSFSPIAMASTHKPNSSAARTPTHLADIPQVDARSAPFERDGSVILTRLEPKGAQRCHPARSIATRGMLVAPDRGIVDHSVTRRVRFALGWLDTTLHRARFNRSMRGRDRAFESRGSSITLSGSVAEVRVRFLHPSHFQRVPQPDQSAAPGTRALRVLTLPRLLVVAYGRPSTTPPISMASSLRAIRLAVVRLLSPLRRDSAEGFGRSCEPERGCNPRAFLSLHAHSF
jgi:hypothetical protein